MYHCLGQVSATLHAAIQTRLQPTQPLNFLSSWLVLVLPLLLSMTLWFASYPTILFVLLSVPTGLLLCSLMPESGTPLPLRQPPVSSASTSINEVRIPPLPELTTYWAHMMLMTVLSILNRFPSIFAFPCEMRNLWSFFGMKLGLWLLFYHLTLKKNLDGPWCRIFYVLAKPCICLLYNLLKTPPI